jgi:hypothetical protein
MRHFASVAIDMTTIAFSSHMKRSLYIIPVVVLFMVGLSIAPTQATIVYDSVGFEPPKFTAGLLEGQDGWVRTGNAAGGQVQIAVVESGNQAVQVTRAPNEDARWGVLTTGFPSPLTDPISIQWDMNVLPSGVPSGSFGPFFGVESYADVAGLSFLGSLGVDAGTGDLLYLDPVNGFTETGVTVPFATWHNYELLLDFASDSYSIFFDGALQLSGIGFTTPSDTFSDAPIATVGAAADAISQAAIGSAFFDNYVITSIPEPSAVLFGVVVCTCVGASVVVRRKWAGGAKVADE